MVVDTHVDGIVEALEEWARNMLTNTEKFTASFKRLRLIFIIFEAVTAERLTTSFQEYSLAIS